MPGRAAPTVSVVIPAYNPGAYLREAIGSVVAQTFTDWELIVVDDGSREDLAWVPSIDPRVSLVHQRNQGTSAARNRGIAVSCGRFIAFLDQDDRWRPTKLERQVELLRTGSVFCHTGFDLIDGGGSRMGPGWGAKGSYLGMLAGQIGILLSSSIVDRTVLLRGALFDPRLRITQDYDLFLRLARSCEFSYLPTVEVDYRLHDDNTSRDYWRGFLEWRSLHAREACLGSSRNDTAVGRAVHEGAPIVRRNYAFQAIDAARSAAQTHRALDTARHLVQAARLDPGVAHHSCVLFVKSHLRR